jgi:hypothetical protein
MNERIKQLYVEATGKDWAYDFDPQVAEKFAELLLKDCVSNVRVWEKDSRNHISYMLKNHYDIEV